MSLLVDLNSYGNLQWDCVLSTELVRRYKPDLETYRMVCDLLDVVPERAMMVAAHSADLLAAHQIGMKTAFVRRPLEFGPEREPAKPDPLFDLIVNDLLDLARQI